MAGETYAAQRFKLESAQNIATSLYDYRNRSKDSISGVPTASLSPVGSTYSSLFYTHGLGSLRTPLSESFGRVQYLKSDAERRLM